MNLHAQQKAMLERQETTEKALKKHLENGEPVSLDRAVAMVSAILPCSEPTAKSYIHRLIETRKLNLVDGYLKVKNHE